MRHKTFYEQPARARMNENDNTPTKQIQLFDAASS